MLPPTVRHNRGASEFKEVLEILQSRRGGKALKGPHVWASDVKPIHRGAVPHSVTVHTLSPSSATLTRSHLAFLSRMPRASDGMNPLPDVQPNELSIVLHVSTPYVGFLLGGDLETTGDEDRGWIAVINSEFRPHEKSAVYKVAHHGSENADHPRIWSEMLHPRCLSLVSPYAAGRKPRPDRSDIERLFGHGSRVSCTVWPPTRPPARRRVVDAIVRDVAKSRQAVSPRPGHIRVRVAFNGSQNSIETEYFDGAS